MAIVVSDVCAWAPGLVSNEDWQAWARGEKNISLVKDAPKLEYTDMLFRRRLSQISKMTVQVVHDLLQKNERVKNAKQVFVSCRGEISREFAVSKTLVETQNILPAAFSLSVFNAPIALASIALGLRSGYSVIFPSKGDFSAAFQAAAAPLLSGDENEIALIYADERAPSEYDTLGAGVFEPLAFAAFLSRSDIARSEATAERGEVAARRVIINNITTAAENDSRTTEHMAERGFVINNITTVPKEAAAFLKLIIQRS